VELNRITNPQLGQGGGRGINTDASYLNHGGAGGTGFHDKLAAIDGSSSQIHAACRGKSSPPKTGPIVLRIRSLIFCEHICCKKICKGLYMSGNLRDNRALIAGEDGNSSMVGFT